MVFKETSERGFSYDFQPQSSSANIIKPVENALKFFLGKIVYLILSLKNNYRAKTAAHTFSSFRVILIDLQLDRISRFISLKNKANLAGPTGVEPATLGLKVRCSSLTELRTRKDSLRLIGKHEGVF